MHCRYSLFGFFCASAIIVTSAEAQRPELDVSLLGPNSAGNREWLVAVTPAAASGSLAVELAFSLAGSDFVNIDVNEAAWDRPNPGNNPFTGTITQGLWVGPTGDKSFGAFGSTILSGGSPVELFRLETRGLDTTTLKWGEQASPDPTKGDIIASIAGNFRNYSGSLTAQGPVKPAQGNVVFDSLTGAERLSGGIGLSGTKQAGSIIHLEGAARLVTRLDVAIREFSTLPGSVDFKINLWTADDFPGELIWSSPVQHADGLTRDVRLVSVDVPHVEVPDRFGWTLEKVSTTLSPGIPGFPHPSVGTVEAIWWENEPSGWQSVLPISGGFGFRVIAVPEPTTSVVLLAGISLLVVQTSRSGRDRRYSCQPFSAA